MKSFEQIAQAMHEAFLKERRNQGSASTAYAGWDALGKDQQADSPKVRIVQMVGGYANPLLRYDRESGWRPVLTHADAEEAQA